MVDGHSKLSSLHLQPSDDTGMGHQGSRSQRFILSSGQGIAWSLRLYVSVTTFALCSRARFTYTKVTESCIPQVSVWVMRFKVNSEATSQQMSIHDGLRCGCADPSDRMQGKCLCNRGYEMSSRVPCKPTPEN